MKKILSIITTVLLLLVIAVSCAQDVTVDTQLYGAQGSGTFMLNGKYYNTLQEAVNARLGKGAKAAGANDDVIYLTRNAKGPGAKIDDPNISVIIDFAGWTYSFTDVTATQGSTSGTFGLSITDGANVTLKGLEQIDLHDTTANLTMVYVEGADTKLTIEDAPKMKVEPTQYVFWAANGATLTVGSNSTTAPTTISGKIAATGGTSETSKPVVTFNNNTTVKASELKADAAVVIINSSEASTVDSFVAANNTQVVVSGSGNVTVTDNNSESTATYTIENTSSDTNTKVDIPTTSGENRTVTPGQKVDNDEDPVVDPTPSVARIGSSLYKSLADAVNAATAGQTVTMLKDVTYPAAPYQASNAPVTISKSLTLDGNGFTLTSTSTADSASRLIRVYKAYGDDTTEQALSNHIEVNIVNLTVVAIQNNGYAIVYDENVSGTISNCTVTSGSNGIAVRGYSSYGNGDRAENSVLTVSNCAVTGDGSKKESSKANIYGAALDVEHGATLIVDGGVYDSIYDEGQAVSVTTMSSAGTIIINGGTFNKPIWLNKKDNSTYGKMWDGSAYVVSNPPIVVKVNGGTFVATDSVAYESANIDSYTTMTITSGTFSADPSDYVADGYVAKKISSNEWTVVKESDEIAVVTTTKTETMSLARFRNKWNDGDYSSGFVSATLIADVVDISSDPWQSIGTWANPFYGIFDGNGKTVIGLNVNNDSTSGEIFTTDTVKSTGVAYGFIGLVGNGDVTIRNLTLSEVDINVPNIGNCVGAIIGYAPTTDEFTSKGRIYGGSSNIESSNVTITGCTVQGANNKAISVKDCAGGIMGKAYNSGALVIQNCITDIEVRANNGRSAGICGYVSGPTSVSVTGNTVKKDVYATKTIVDKIAAFTFIGKDYVYDNNTTDMKAYFMVNSKFVEQTDCYSLIYSYENNVAQTVTFSNDLSKAKYGDVASARVANFKDGTIISDASASKDFSFDGTIVVQSLNTNGNTINIFSGVTTINAGSFNQVAVKNSSSLIVNGGDFASGKYIISSANGTVTLNSISNTTVLNYENAGTFNINCVGDFTVYSYLNNSHETTSHSFYSDDGKCHYVINDDLSFIIADTPQTVGTYRHIIISAGE